MELFKFCLEIVKREGEKFNAGIAPSVNEITAATAADVNYDIVKNRCAYVYRCGSINISFAQDCFRMFMTEYRDISTLLSQWMCCPNLTLCSLTTGPALDFIALLILCCEYATPSPLFKNVNVISKHGAWRNTIKIMHQVISEEHLNYLPSTAIEKIDVIQGDPLIDFSQKVKDPISNADVIMMMKTINLPADASCLNKLSKSLSELFDVMKPGATLFCIDTKPNIALIVHEILKFSGNFLYNPVVINTKLDLELPDVFKNTVGCFPLISARGKFFVWKKSFIGLPNTVAECQSPKYFEMQVTKAVVEDSTKVNGTQLNQMHANSSVLCSYNGKKSVDSSSDYSSVSSNFVDNYSETCLSSENSTSALVDSLSNSQHSLGYDGVSSTHDFGSFRSWRSLKSIKHEVPNYGSISKENTFFKNEEKTQSNCSITQKSTQTEPEISSSATDSFRVSSLINRISKLTTAIKILLQKNETQCSNTESLDEKNNKCDCSIFKNYINKQCSSTSCMNDYLNHSLCSSHSSCMCVCYRRKHLENCCCNHNNCCNALHVPKCCSTSCCNESKFSSPNPSVTSPNLVIPLNNLSSDAVSQIISLLSHYKQETS